MAQRDQPITGFEGVQDSLLYDTLKQAEYQKRVLEQRAMDDPFDRAIDAFGGLLSIGVDRLAPPLAQRNARAVTEARANALRAVEGQEFESPYLRQVAVVEAAADELDRQGLGSSAEQLRANALALRSQALEFKRLTAQTKVEELNVDILTPKAKNAEALSDAELAQQVADARAAELEADYRSDTYDYRVEQERLKRDADRFTVAFKLPQELRSARAAEQASLASAEANRLATELRREGQGMNAVVPGYGVVYGMRQRNGDFAFRDRNGTPVVVPGGLAPEASLTGGEGDVNPRGGLQTKALQGQVAAGNFIKTATDLQALWDSNPNTTSWAGQAAGILGRAGAQARAALAVTQGGTEMLARNRQLFDDTFSRDYNYLTTQERAMVEDLTYAKAGSREPGVLSRTDIEGAAQSLGFDNPDPAVRRVALSRAVSDIHSTTVRTAEAAGTPILPGYKSLYSAWKEREAAAQARAAQRTPRPGGPSGGRSGPPATRPAAGAVRDRTNWNP